MNDEFKTLKKFDAGKGREGFLHSLPALEEQGIGKISRLPVSIRIVLESVLRNCDGKKSGAKMSKRWRTGTRNLRRTRRSHSSSRALFLQDFTGVPLVVDLAAMRSAVKRLGRDPKIIEPLVPVDLVVDHSVQVDFFGSARALGTEFGHGVQAQPRALPVSEVGTAGVQNFPAHSAGHRHRASGESRIPRERRSFARINPQLSTLNFSSPTRSSAPIRTRR